MARSHLVCFYHSDSDVSDLVTAALHPELGIKTVSIFCKMQDRTEANHVAASLRAHRLNVNLLGVKSFWDSPSFTDSIQGLLEQQQTNIQLNLSHLPPSASIAAYDLAQKYALQTFAIEPHTDTLHWLHNPALARPIKSDVPDTLTLQHYLRSNGLECIDIQRLNTPVDPSYFECAKALASALKKHPHLISLIAQATTGMSGNVSPQRLPDQVRHALAPLTKHGLFRIRETGHLEIDNPLVNGFIRGGWLEYLVYQSILDLKTELNLMDVAMGVKVEHVSGFKNELDVMFMRNNQLYAIECKSLSPKSQLNDLEWVFKIDSVADILGFNTPAMLAFVAEPTNNTLTQATERSIQVVYGHELEQIGQKIKAWIKQVEN